VLSLASLWFSDSFKFWCLWILCFTSSVTNFLGFFYGAELCHLLILLLVLTMVSLST
jgi:hypothetical protein